MKKVKFLWIFIMVIVFYQSSAIAQMNIKFRGNGGWCFGERYDQHFVNSRLESVVGEVLSIDTITPFRGMSQGIQIVLKTDREEIAVHLGPAWFILFQEMTLSVNDKNIEVRGCRTNINGKQVIMATQLVRRDRILLLRDKDGIPYWCAWRPKFN